MSAASCVQEEKEEKEIQEPSDAIAQGNYMVELPHLTLPVKLQLESTLPHISGISLWCSAVHHLLVGTWDVCLQYMPAVLSSYFPLITFYMELISVEQCISQQHFSTCTF